jgi:hypothetical protein
MGFHHPYLVPLFPMQAEAEAVVIPLELQDLAAQVVAALVE